MDLDRSLTFYRDALGLEPVRRKTASDGSLPAGVPGRWRDRFSAGADLAAGSGRKALRSGECEFHLAFVTDQYDALYAKHKEMGCVCFENPAMGIYFISDPDGYWIEIVPVKD